MPKPAKDVAASLLKKGFVCKDSHHHFYHLVIDGKKTAIYTKISHGEKEIHDGLLSTMARQLKLNKRQFGEFVDCPLDLERYKELLRQAGAVEVPPESQKQ